MGVQLIPVQENIIMGVQLIPVFDLDFSLAFYLAFVLISTFARLLKNKQQMRHRGMDATIRFSASGTR